jgi:hypothetical protein
MIMKSAKCVYTLPSYIDLFDYGVIVSDVHQPKEQHMNKFFSRFALAAAVVMIFAAVIGIGVSGFQGLAGWSAVGLTGVVAFLSAYIGDQFCNLSPVETRQVRTGPVFASCVILGLVLLWPASQAQKVTGFQDAFLILSLGVTIAIWFKAFITVLAVRQKQALYRDPSVPN